MVYSVKEAANILKCDPETVRRKIRTGNLKAIKFGTQFKVKEEDIITMLKETITGINLDGMSLSDIVNFIKI